MGGGWVEMGRGGDWSEGWERKSWWRPWVELGLGGGRGGEMEGDGGDGKGMVGVGDGDGRR